MESKQLRSLRIQAWALIGMLVLQYAVGMYVNLFVAFPAKATAGQLWEFAWSQMPIAIHIILAFLILLGAIVLCVRAIQYRNAVWIWSSCIGLLAMLAAGASGTTFIPTQTDIYSYSMALWFIVGLGAFGWALYS